MSTIVNYIISLTQCQNISAPRLHMSVSIYVEYIYVSREFKRYIFFRIAMVYVLELSQLLHTSPIFFRCLTINQPTIPPNGPSSFSKALVGIDLARLARRTAAPRAPKVIPAAAVPKGNSSQFWEGNIREIRSGISTLNLVSWILSIDTFHQI